MDTERFVTGLPILLLALALAPVAARANPEEAPPLHFEGEVRAVLKAHCFHCHGEDGSRKGGLDVRLRHLLVSGGKSGPAVSPGQPGKSLLLERIEAGEMPPAEVALRPTPEEIEILRRWIEAGAPTARPEPADPDQLPRITPEEREHWAFQPIAAPAVPRLEGPGADRIRNPIDAFVLRRLREEGRTFSPDADRRTLIRRLTFDLIGLPPTPAEVEEFVEDPRPEAHVWLIERLLASPAYGERWGRHWLDVVGYADSEGYTDSDLPRPDAYRYRDYVIDSFNRDLPFDRFIVEQLAGDELVTSPLDRLTPEDRGLLTATGFLRMAPDGTGSRPDDPVMARHAVVDSTIQIISTSLMGMTVGCARCHDHRFDPILHDDYYRLRAVLDPALNLEKWKPPASRRVSLATPEQRAHDAEIDREVTAARQELDRREAECIEVVFERELRKIPAELREAAREARKTSAQERNEDQKKLLRDHPNLLVRGGSALDLYLELFEEGRKMKKELDGLRSRVSKIRSRKKPVEGIRGLTETDDDLPVTRVLHRGDPTQPTRKVRPGSLTVLDHLLEVDLPVDDETLPSTGRRLALARHLTRPEHPLTSRVLVNRFWMHHFGRGLVPTPGDFGRQGEPPTHPELLDWLALEFQRRGWSLKNFHHLVMTSTTYLQSSRRLDPSFDPHNRLLGRQSIRRLEAETIRDAILAVSGQLLPGTPGPPTPVRQTGEGQTIVSTDIQDGAPSRRSIYIQARRSTPLAMLEVFDAPRPEPNCSVREVSTVTPQSLLLMNSETVVRQSAAFALRVIEEVGEDPRNQVRHAWKLALGKEPDERELRHCLELLDDQTRHFTEIASPGKKDEKVLPPDREALRSLCMVLLGSNSFLYVD